MSGRFAATTMLLFQKAEAHGAPPLVKLRERLLDLFFPPRCPVCDRVVARGEVFCAPCLSELVRTRTPRVSRGERFAFSDFVFLVDYDRRTRPAVLRMKRIPGSAEAAVFGLALSRLVRETYPDTSFSAVVPVPMSEEKRRRRGFNHAEALAAVVAGQLGVPLCCDLLCQRENAPAQHTLGRAERFRSAAAHYFAATGAAVAGTVLLIDDILTSGATLDRCAALLREKGAADVIAATAAATPYQNASPAAEDPPSP